MSVFRTIPFNEFQVVFDDETMLKVLKTPVRQQPDQDVETSTDKLTLSLFKSGVERETFEPKRQHQTMNIPPSAITEFVPDLLRRGGNRWLHTSTGEVLTLDDVVERFGDYLPFPTKRRGEPEWFRNVKDSIEVRFIQTQRLFVLAAKSSAPTYQTAPPLKEVVIDYCKELAGAIERTLSEYGELSQSLDRTFPSRLVQEEVPAGVSIETLRLQLGELEEKRNRLTAAGLLGKEKEADILVPPTVDERTKSVLSVYVKDNQNKLSTFDEMAAKIDLFKKIIDARFKYKKMNISRENGITFTSFHGSPLSPASLSSGEQHELVLLYDLIFKIKPNSLILIDEPEISLHISWQEQFLEDLQQITKLTAFDVLIATHSPQIIYDRWDLTVDLKGPDQEPLSDSHQESKIKEISSR